MKKTTKKPTKTKNPLRVPVLPPKDLRAIAAGAMEQMNKREESRKGG